MGNFLPENSATITVKFGAKAACAGVFSRSDNRVAVEGQQAAAAAAAAATAAAAGPAKSRMN